jgi:agmatine deiminase
MITDCNKNLVYFSELLKKPEYKTFLNRLRRNLALSGIEIRFLDGTKDIWCRDYMPVEVSCGKFVLFNYNPIYLKGCENIITDNEAVCKSLGIDYLKSPLKIDGGNIVCSENKVILTDRIFMDNPTVGEKQLLNKLKKLFEADDIIIIPANPDDILGHADGVVRFVDDNTVIVNNFRNSKESVAFQNNLFGVLGRHGLNIIQVPYTPDYKKTDDCIDSAMGCYINYLQVGKDIFLPFFGNKRKDNEALLCFERIFGKNVYPIESSIIAKKGGALNCISWCFSELNDEGCEINTDDVHYYQLRYYVFDHVNFRLFSEEFDDIYDSVQSYFNNDKEGKGDIKSYVNSFLVHYRPNEPLIPQYVVEGVIDRILDYRCAIGPDVFCWVERDIPTER